MSVWPFYYADWVYDPEDPPEEEDLPEIEGTDAAKEAFKAKMRAWRAEGGTPGYIGPRAGRDG